MRRGFTLIELMVVVAILAILILAGIVSLTKYRGKADDSRSMSDLDRPKIAFEEYYNDNNCYPPAEWFDAAADCGSSNLSPYLSAIPCDRKTGLPYVIETDSTGCGWFRAYATLNFPTAGCLGGNPDDGNYCVSSNNAVATPTSPAPSAAASSTPTPAPSSSPGLSPLPSLPPGQYYYYCSTLGNCTFIDDPAHKTCTPVYANDGLCGGTIYSNCPVVSTCTTF